MPARGLSAANRAFVSNLNRSFQGPFTTDDVVRVTQLDRDRVSRLVRHLVSQGWLRRVQRGLYITVPLEAEDSTAWNPDPWTVAAAAFEPGYVAGWTALSQWGLTDQIFTTTAFVTARAVPRTNRTVGA